MLAEPPRLLVLTDQLSEPPLLYRLRQVDEPRPHLRHGLRRIHDLPEGAPHVALGRSTIVAPFLDKFLQEPSPSTVYAINYLLRAQGLLLVIAVIIPQFVPDAHLEEVLVAGVPVQLVVSSPGRKDVVGGRIGYEGGGRGESRGEDDGYACRRLLPCLLLERRLWPGLRLGLERVGASRCAHRLRGRLRPVIRRFDPRHVRQDVHSGRLRSGQRQGGGFALCPRPRSGCHLVRTHCRLWCVRELSFGAILQRRRLADSRRCIRPGRRRLWSLKRRGSRRSGGGCCRRWRRDGHGGPG
mmetsp:Transcript_16220/g.46747  ORF Transcript_16220/g.46747 Transcript_16220/m.46747 type:complete len:297 (-) Transcript_16220:130-1020(-)